MTSRFSALAVVVACALSSAPRANAAASGEPAAEPRRFALVVGANESDRRDLPRLRFADDDAIRDAELLRAMGAEVTLLIAPDDETRALFPRESAASGPPTRARVLAEVAAIFRAAAEAKTRGDAVDFYFVFAGHGGFTDGGDGALFLPDAPLTRRDLYESILARSPADFNHLLVDACHSYFFVSSRGADDVDRRLDARAREYLGSQTLDRFPNTGVAVATSAADTTVEWSDYQGGVFSHELRSALLGAGDVDGDGQVTYAELGAFIAAANAKVNHVRARLNVFVRAPARERARPLVSWRKAPLASLSIGGGVAGHLWLEDERGLRLSEVNKSGERPLRLALLQRERYYLRVGEEEYSFQASPGQQVELGGLTPGAPHANERGGVVDALRAGLFAVPFGPTYYHGYVVGFVDTSVGSAGEAPVGDAMALSARASGGDRGPLRVGRPVVILGGAALVAGAAAIGLRVASDHAYDRFTGATTFDERQRWATRTNQLDWATLLTALGAGASALTAAGLLAHDNWSR
jgi:hypothetical protein